MQRNIETMVIFLIPNQGQDTQYTLIISPSPTSNMGEVIKPHSSTPSNVTFEVQSHSRIIPQLIEEAIEVRCFRDESKFVFSKEQYRHIIRQINKQNHHQNSDSSESESSEESEPDSENQMIQTNNKKGRGRPKGSKNKKTLMKEQEQGHKFIEFHQAIKQKRGKGRPKGSKNKPKTKLDLIKIQVSQNPPFGKRGKGRPKGSKNKIKVADQLPIVENSLLKIKRGRGRPKGAKNKQNSSPDISYDKEESEEIEKKQYTRIDKEDIDKITCCGRCHQRNLKIKILEGEIQFSDAVDNLLGICNDISLENKKNILLEVIKAGNHQLLELVLSIKDKQEDFFKPPWQTDSIMEKTRFQVKTRKQYLSKTGKEGIYVLLHDSSNKNDIWWKNIGIERIIEAIPQNDPEPILSLLIENNENFKEQLYDNLPTILRCGNDNLALLILKDILKNPSLNKYNYSLQHEQLLIGNEKSLNQLQKFNLIKHNDGTNFCSPIHCAAITSDPKFLEKLLDNFRDSISKGDSIQRKPIHYASASRNLQNLRALVEFDAELKEIDRKKMTPLMIASELGLAENVSFILEKVRDPLYINFRSDEGYTALHYAVLKDHIECVQILIDDPVFIEINDEIKQIFAQLFYLVAGTGNSQIFKLLIEKSSSSLATCYEKNEKFKKTPAMIAIRNHNNQILYKLLDEGYKISKCDSSQNSLLHYAAAYGNIEAIILLRDILQQKTNKRGYYPWQFAIMKGHLGCAQLLQNEQFEFKKHDPLYLLLTNIRGTEQYLSCVTYVQENFTDSINYQEETTGNGYLHLVCAIGEDQYLKQRITQINMTQEQIRQEFNELQGLLIDFFKDNGLDGYLENKKKQTPLKMCIQNINLVGFRKLLTNPINFDIESGDGSTIMHRLSNLACKGIKQMQFVQEKLKQAAKSDLKINLKKIDQNGFDFLLYFVKNFTETIKQTFHHHKKEFIKKNKTESEAEEQAFKEFIKFEEKFMKLVAYLMDLGCDINGQVMDKRATCMQNFKKWGFQHFLMRFPSLKLIKFFKNKIRDFNAQNNDGMTPLHLFCKNMFDGNLLDAQLTKIPSDYDTCAIIEYLLQNGLNPNAKDSDRSYPILYSALNHQYQFIMILLKHKSQINSVNLKNQVPFIEIIKNHKNYSIEEISSILRYVKPNFQDQLKRTALHHLVACSSNFDESPQVCKLLLSHGFKINALDQYNRSPIFYCFDPDDQGIDEPNDKVQLLHLMINLNEINLNLLDLYKRSLVHYACRKNYFFSILYLVDHNINFQIKDHEDNTPLGVCLKHRNLDQAALIIKKGIRPGHVNDGSEKLSYFAYAVKNLSVGICFILLDHGYPIQKALQEVENEAFKEILKKKYIR